MNIKETKLYLLLIAIPISVPLFSQIYNSDLNRHWMGEINKFNFENSSLSLNDTTKSGSARIFYRSSISNNAEWKLNYELEFNPSTSNFFRYYILLTDTLFDENSKGYFIEAGGRNDDIRLFYFENDIEKMIIDGRDDILSDDVNGGQIIISRNEYIWKLDLLLEADTINLGESYHTDLIYSFYSSLECIFTSTRFDKFSFSNIISYGDFFLDEYSPELDSLVVSGIDELNLYFNEPVYINSETTFETTLRIPEPFTVSNTGNKITLGFLSDFESGKSQNLIVQNVSDSAGNIFSDTLSFYFIKEIKPGFRDIVINEIMADPTPKKELQESEFIEILNTSDNPFQLKGWRFSDGNTHSKIQNYYIIFPDSTVILSKDSANHHNQITLESFPSLNNGGETIYLISPDKSIIDSLEYNSTMYGDVLKARGGWTLEQIDPFKNCSGPENWSASIDERGGTPGRKNSIYKSPLDVSGPRIESVEMSDNLLKIEFNENIGNNFQLYIDPVVSIDSSYTVETSLLVSTSLPFQRRQLYKISVTDVEDCEGNITEKLEMETAIPETPENGDLLINEILFNPEPGGIDFLEVINVSPKYLSTRDIKLGGYERNEMIHKSIEEEVLVYPNEILAFCRNKTLLSTRYKIGNMLENPLPSYPDTEGYVLLCNGQNVIIDSIYYSEEYHYPLLEEREGVSLEQLSTGRPSTNRNWSSASSTSGYGTPGLKNSQLISINPEIMEWSANPRVLLNDASNAEYISLSYNLKNGPWSGSIKILSVNGAVVDEIINNEVLGNSGTVVWDGTSNGELVNTGIYIAQLDILNSTGDVKTVRTTIVVGRKLP